MQGVISFHPVDPGFFETLIEPLLRGEKVNPETFLEAARRTRRAAWLTLGYKTALERLLDELEPPPPPDEGTLWDKVRTRLERFDYKVPPLARVAQATIEPDLHLHGRPFLVTEGAPDRVAEIVTEYVGAAGDAGLTSLVLDQLGRLDAALARGIEPEPIEEPSPDPAYRSELLDGLRKIHEWGQAARDERSGGRIASRTRADLADELPWHVVHLHSRAVPFWVARDVDGLGTICEATGIEPPSGLTSASSLFAGVGAELPELRERLRADMRGPRELGGFASPQHVPALLAFLLEHGGRMIQVATRHGQGPLCTRVLRKIRECLRFAERHGVGYLEASGIHPLLEEPTESAAAVDSVASTSPRRSR
jgi:hypothetical protein